jgi:hypothetical protein
LKNWRKGPEIIRCTPMPARENPIGELATKAQEAVTRLTSF